MEIFSVLIKPHSQAVTIILGWMLWPPGSPVTFPAMTLHPTCIPDPPPFPLQRSKVLLRLTDKSSTSANVPKKEQLQTPTTPLSTSVFPQMLARKGVYKVRMESSSVKIVLPGILFSSVLHYWK